MVKMGKMVGIGKIVETGMIAGMRKVRVGGEKEVKTKKEKEMKTNKKKK